MSMADELGEAPLVVERQAVDLLPPMRALVAELGERQPRLVVSCARGSSAHAATFAKHLIELHLGIPVAEAAPNIASVYRRRLSLDGQLFLAISQSGRSDDLVDNAVMARKAGATTAALVNDMESPLAAACDFVLPLGAGPERSIAATKTLVASLAALVRLAALWADDRALTAALDRLPARLAAAGELDWNAAIDAITAAPSLVAIGRGPTLAIAREAALKLKEVANIHAEAFSGAEFLHGPVALVAREYPILVLSPSDVAAEGLRRLVVELKTKGATLLTAMPGGTLPVLAAEQAETDAICLVQSFYAMIPRLAARLGIDPDRPRHLEKVTRTR